MPYELIFKTKKGETVFIAESLSQEKLQQAVKLKNNAPKVFIIDKAAMRGRMIYNNSSILDFDIKRRKKIGG